MSDEEDNVYVELPVAQFPPFKLRSSMVDKDPVIWVHEIEVYITYIQTLLQLKRQLSQRSEQQLCLFLKSYLHEIAEEQGQILSLGLINVQITQNLDILRSWILELIKQLGVLNLKLNGAALWDFAKVYAAKNATIVKGIIDGTYKPKDKKTINSISLVHKHLEHLITNGKFEKHDLETLAVLLQKSAKVQTESKATKEPFLKQTKAKKGTSFGETFVTLSWIDMLEKLYANGEGKFSKLVRNLAVLSLVSVPIAKVASIGTELGINTYSSLRLYPLFGGIIASESFKELNPGIEQRFPFLIKQPKSDVNEADVKTLTELFPDLSISHTAKLLKKHNNNVEEVTMLLLEHPEAAIEKKEDKSRHVMENKTKNVKLLSNRSKLQKESELHVPDELKNKTLTSALRLMYEADEDEHDDTYDEAEAVTPDEKGKFDKAEKILWEAYKRDPNVFAKPNRRWNERQQLVQTLHWSHEQIEGWARMLEKEPRRVRILEQKYQFRGNKPQRRTEEDEEIAEERRPPPSSSTDSHNDQNKKKPNQTVKANPANVKRQNAKNEKNKSSKANHNRKSGHDKKMARGLQ